MTGLVPGSATIRLGAASLAYLAGHAGSGWNAAASQDRARRLPSFAGSRLGVALAGEEPGGEGAFAPVAEIAMAEMIL